MQNTNITKNQINIEENKQLSSYLWITKNFTYILTLITCIWCGLIYLYIESFIGIANIFTLEPIDFSAFLFASTIPLFLLWYILAYIKRSSGLDTNAKLFCTYIDGLLYPNDDATKNAKAFSFVLQEQIKQMQTQSTKVIKHSINIKNQLDDRITSFSETLKLLETFSTQTLKELEISVNNIVDKCEYTTQKTTASIENMNSCSDDITQNTDSFLNKLSPILNEISAISSNVRNNINENKQTLSEIKNQLSNCNEITQENFNQLLDKSKENAAILETSFYKTAEECEVIYKKIDTSISSIEGRIEEQKQIINSQTQLVEFNSEQLNDKIIKFGSTIANEFEKLVRNSSELEEITTNQIKTLKSINMETDKTINNIGFSLDDKRISIEQSSKKAVSSTQNVIEAITIEIDKLNNFYNLTQTKNIDLQNMTETIVDKISDISHRMSIKTDELKNNAVGVIDKFIEASEVINQNVETITSSSDQITNTSKDSFERFEQQRLAITSTLANIDKMKDKLDEINIKIKNTNENIDTNIQEIENSIELNESIFSIEQITSIATDLNKTLNNIGVLVDKQYQGKDMYDLWENLLSGKTDVFYTAITKSLTKKNIIAIRKTFDNNTTFHSQVVKYLFLMDLMIKEISNSTTEQRNELINISVKSSFDKIYYILLKVINNVE